MAVWWQGVADDFSDIGDLSSLVRVGVRLLLAALLGGLLGLERTWAGKEPGLRTHMLLALGSAFFVVIPQQAGMSSSDLSRVFQGLLAGIGFLGAGAILKPEGQTQVRGMTTAAGLWLTAAVGAAAGFGREASAVLVTLLALAILSLLLQLEKRTGLRAKRKENEEGPGGPQPPRGMSV